MTTSRLRLGQLLVDARLITQEALDDVLVAQKQDGRRLGTLLVERGHISEVQLTQILSHQLSVPWVSLMKIEFSRQLLNLVPREVADQYCLLPIYVRRPRGQGDTLYIAMDDPTNEEALRACSAHAGIPVRPMIAPPSDIRSAIRAYYDVTTEAAAPASGPKASPNVTPEPLAMRPERGSPAATADSAKSETTAREGSGAREHAAAMESATHAPRPETHDATAEIHIERPAHVPPPPRAQAVASAEAHAPNDVASRAAAEDPARHARAKTHRSALHEEAGPTIEITGEAPIEVPPTMRESSKLPPESSEAAIDLPSARRSEPGAIPAPRGKQPRMVSLTLLDGTTITLPARPKKRAPVPDATPEPDLDFGPRGSEPPPEHMSSLTARDLVAALRAVAAGADASTILGDDVRWETMFAALLSLMLRKQIIADWEFVEELNRLKKR